MMTPLKLYVENKFAPSSVPLAEAQVVWSRGTGSWFLSPIRRESLRAKLTKMMAPLESNTSHVNISSRFSYRCGQQHRGLDFVANYARGDRWPRRRVVGFCSHPKRFPVCKVSQKYGTSEFGGVDCIDFVEIYASVFIGSNGM